MNDEHEGFKTIEIIAAVIVLAFVATVLFVFLSAIAGAVWWIVKMAILVVVLWLLIRWAARHARK